MPRLSSPKARRALATTLFVLTGVLVVGAAGLAGYPYFTNQRATIKQNHLRQTFVTAEVKQAYAARKVSVGSPLTRIMIPRIGVDAVVVEGTNAKALAAGAGHYPETPLPGEAGNVAIAGHRTMNGKPFADLDRVSPGDKVILVTPFAKHTYEVVSSFDSHANPWVTTPNDWTIVAPTKVPMLTLTTCHPKGTARQRLVARAKLVSSEPVRSA